MYVNFDEFTGRHRHNHCCLENFSEIKNEKEILIINVEMKKYSEIVKMHFFFKVIFTTFSFQFEMFQSKITLSNVYEFKTFEMFSLISMCITKESRFLNESNF